MEDLLLRLSARAGAFAYLDLPSKLEVFALSSFACCMLGGLSSSYPFATNSAVALLALVACRSRSEAQLACLCGFSLYTTITDIIAVCIHPTGWGGVMTIANLVLKLNLAIYSYRLMDALSELSDEMAPRDEGTSGPAASGFPTAYHAPSLKDDDYAAMAAEAADRHANDVGDVTRYRAI